MKVRLIARPSFIALPEELGTPAPGQLQGPDGQKVIETAGRVCYDSFGRGRSSEDFAKHLLEVGHVNPMYHAVYVFFITGVSRGFSHELVRHHVGVSPSQRSTRYCDEGVSPWIKHPLFEERAPRGLQNRWDGAVELCRAVYDETVAYLQRDLEDDGVPSFNARKQARGAARGILGNALETELVWSANVHAIRNILVQRGSEHADAEIRAFAVRLYDIMKQELPVYFGDFRVEEAPDGLGATVTKR